MAAAHFPPRAGCRDQGARQRQQRRHLAVGRRAIRPGEVGQRLGDPGNGGAGRPRRAPAPASRLDVQAAAHARPMTSSRRPRIDATSTLRDGYVGGNTHVGAVGEPPVPAQPRQRIEMSQRQPVRRRARSAEAAAVDRVPTTSRSGRARRPAAPRAYLALPPGAAGARRQRRASDDAFAPVIASDGFRRRCGSWPAAP